MQTANHILSKEGILTTFSIAKKIAVKDIKKLRDGLKNSKGDAKKFEEQLREAVIKRAMESLDSKNVPGILMDGIFAENEEKKRIMELTYFASIVAKKLAEKRVSKYHSCYIVNAIVNMLGLSEEDFDDFHKKFARFREGKNENDEQSE